MHCVQAAVSVDFLLAMHLCGFFTHMHGSFSRAYEGGFFTLPESALPESYLLFLTISQRFIIPYNLPEIYYSLQSPRDLLFFTLPESVAINSLAVSIPHLRYLS